MRAVEGLLTPEPQTMHELAAAVYEVPHDELTRAQIEAIRRACKRLAELDRATLAPVRRQVKAGGGGSRQTFLAARTPMTEQEREEASQRQAEAVANLMATLAAR